MPGKTYLDLNEPIFDHAMNPMETVVSKGVATLRRVVSQYPLDSTLDAELRGRFVGYLDARVGTAAERQTSSGHLGEALLTPEHVLVTRGSDAALRTIFRAFALPGTTAAMLTPTYHAVFGMLALSPACSVLRIPCTSAMDVAEALDRARRSSASLVYLCNPNNPLGYVADRESILSAVAASPGTLFVVDEAYMDYADDPAESVARSTPLFRNLVVTRTFSKAFGLAGARLGVVVGHPDTLDALRLLTCPTEVPDTSKAMGAACLSPEILLVFRRHFSRVRHLRAWAVDTLRKRLMDDEAGDKGRAGGGLVDILDGGGMFFAIRVVDASVAKNLEGYLDAIWDIVVARRGDEETEDAAAHHHHVVRCQIGDSVTTMMLVRGITTFFGRPLSTTGPTRRTENPKPQEPPPPKTM